MKGFLDQIFFGRIMSEMKLGSADEIGDPPRGPIEFLKFPLFPIP